MKIAVLSDGAWASALAILLINNSHEVRMWCPFSDHVEELRKTRKNTRFLKGHHLPLNLELTDSMAAAIESVDYIVIAAPVQYARNCLNKLREAGGVDASQVVINVSKGIEVGTLKRMSELCQELLGEINYAVLSGPSHAEEVVLGIPTAVVVASTSDQIAREIQKVFMNEVFRVYTGSDVIGVELAGALKNVYAIACGISDGMGLGDNSKAALITRGIAEMARLGQTLGGAPETFSGLSGVGDMIVTCCSRHSRNRHVGEELGRGNSLDAVVAQMGRVIAEGVPTTNSAYVLARQHQIDTPIINEVYAGLYEGKDLRQGVRDLMVRKAKSEN